MEITLILGLGVAVLTGLLGFFLIHSWKKQQHGLLTDMPLMFGIVCLAQSMNMAYQTMLREGLIESTLTLFRIRSIMIAGTVLPLLVVLLQIWFHRYQKYHSRALLLATAYWFLIALFGPSEAFIMMLHIPLLVALMAMMLVTFFITWRTNRLQEVRSDILILALTIGLVGQVMKTPLTGTGMEVVSDVFSMIMMILATIGLTNPWFHLSEKYPQQSVSSESVVDSPPAKKKLHLPSPGRMGLLTLSAFILSVAVLFRISDVLILGLGDTWLNILPSKVIPLALLLYVFWKYRPQDIEPILGISSKDYRVHIVMGLFLFGVLYLVIDVGAVFIYATFVDSSYPLYLTILNGVLLPYLLFFFLVNAIMEEVLFRGLLQNGLKAKFSANSAILLSSVIFGLWHAVWIMVTGELAAGVALVVFSGVLGAFFGVYYEKFSSGRSLIGPILGHTLFNFFNDSFKVGPVQVTQGPNVYTNQGILGIGIMLFVIAFSILFMLFSKYKVEDIHALLAKLRGNVSIRYREKERQEEMVVPVITQASSNTEDLFRS